MGTQDFTELVEKKVDERRVKREERKAAHARKMEVRNKKKIRKIPKGRFDG